LLWRKVEVELIQTPKFLPFYILNIYMKIKGDILEKLKEIDNDSIDLIFTSPPYWKGFEYESYFNSYLQYIKWTEKWTKQIKPKLKENGFFLLNVANDSETTIKAFEIMNICIENGWKLHDTIIMNIYNRQPANTLRNFTNQTEFIFVFRHNSNNVVLNKENIKEEYPNVFESKNIGNIWKLPFKVNKNSNLKKVSGGKTNWGHSGFSKTLCELVIKIFTKENDTILDCFCGNFLLEKIGNVLNRKIIGIDMN
jgi:site-specific DNA-methyltransferase (adenine-specific)